MSAGAPHLGRLGRLGAQLGEALDAGDLPVTDAPGEIPANAPPPPIDWQPAGGPIARLMRMFRRG